MLWARITMAALALTATTTGVKSQVPSVAKKQTAEIITAEMEQMADAQRAALKGKMPVTWEAAAYYRGVAALAHISTNPEYMDELTAMGTKAAWTPNLPKKNPFFADYYAIGLPFLDASAIKHDPSYIAPLKADLDALVDHLNDPAAATAKRPTWWWCDALFMAPPVMARMSAVTGDRKYLDAMDKEYWRTAGLLYDSEEHLFFRDSTYLKKTEPNGKKMIWSRGEGWVFAGLASILNDMPKDSPTRDKYVNLFKDTAATLAPLQGADGLWRAALLDPQAFSGPEVSGTALDCSAFAWGINAGLLDKATYMPVVTKAWAGMLAARRPDGLLGFVQPVGGQPALARPEATQLYGTGAFLLSGAELVKLAPFDIVPLRRLKAPAMPPQKFPTPPEPVENARAFVRYVPERMDDIAWENDRIGFRVFGPALAVHPGDGPESGMDVWVKSTRAMVINERYKGNDYHRNHGDGMDCYETGHSRGCGGLGVWTNGRLYNALDWDTYKILQNGPDVAKFEMTYAPWDANGRKVWETRTITLEAGSNLNRVESVINSDQPGDMIIGIGIVSRKGDAKLLEDKATGLMSYWEPPAGKDGTIGTAVLVDPSQLTEFTTDTDNNLVLIKVTLGKPFVYYTGACWDQGLDFHSAADWESYLKGYKRD